MTVGEIRKAIEGLPDATAVLPDWPGDRGPADYQPGVMLIAVRYQAKGPGMPEPYVSITVDLFELNEEDDEDDDSTDGQT